VTTGGSTGDRARPGRLVPVLVALAGLAAIAVVQCVPNRHSMENDLTRRSANALRAGGMSNVEVSFVGRDGTVRVHSPADGARALAVVRAQRGVRVVVSSGGTPAPPVPATAQPAVTLTIDAGRVVLAGAVPSRSVHDGLLRAASDTFGAGTVDDRLTLDPAVADTGLLALPGVLAALGKDATAVVELRGGTVTLTGSVPTPGAKDAAARAAAAVAGPSAVVDRLTVAPAPGPQVQALLGALPSVTFETGSATLTQQGRGVVASVAAILAANPGVRVSIEGHTDDQGSAGDNLALSQARARAVLDALVAAGIRADRLSAAGFGESRPKVPNTSDANRAVNRRVELIVVA
jgi:OmpA-OmpF porin, OOP family